MTDIFSQARAIPAHEAAQRLGISLTRKGSRYWACCPIHGERTASLCFFEDGRFYCFGCHASGSTVDLYQQLLNLSTPLEAAQRAAADFGISTEPIIDPVPFSTRQRRAEIIRELDLERISEEHRLCTAMHLAAEIASSKSAHTAWDDPEFLQAMDAMCYAQDRLAQTLTYDTEDFAAERLEEASENATVHTPRARSC